MLYGPDLYRRIQQAGRTHDLLCHEPLGFLKFVVRRSGAHIYFLPGDRFEFVEGARAVVCCCRQAESVFYQHALAGMVATVHAADLRQGHVALVDEGNEVLREVVYQAEWPLARFSPIKVARIVLDARAVSHLLDHLQVVLHTLLQSLGFYGLAYLLEPCHLFHQVVLNLGYCCDGPFPVGYEVVRRVDVHAVEGFDTGPGHRVDQADCVDLVAEEFYAHCLVRPSQEHIHGVAAYAEGAALEVSLGAGIKAFDQLIKESCHADSISPVQMYGLAAPIVRIAYAVEA